jgi:putative MFS transporter
MATSVNAGGRLDRLPITAFHYRIFWLVGAGMFFDGYDLYVGTNVLPAALQSGFSTPPLNADFISKTFLGMTIGALVTGFLGDRYGRRFTYQVNLAIFGLASLAAAFAPDMVTLNWVRFVMGLGLGAEIVVGYSTLTEFVPPQSRGRWLAFMSFLVVSGLPVTALLGYLVIPTWGWRPMFVIAGIGALIVWWLRKALPESPRWLEAQGRGAEAEAILAAIEKEAPAPLPPALPAKVLDVDFSALARPPLLMRMIVGSWVLITVNTLIFGFVTWLPQFFVQQGLTITRSFEYTLVLVIASPAGCALGAFCADFVGRRMSIIGASAATVVLGAIYATFTAATPPALVLGVGFFLVLAIYSRSCSGSIRRSCFRPKCGCAPTASATRSAVPRPSCHPSSCWRSPRITAFPACSAS